VNYATENLTERVMALTDGKGADVCFDPIGGDLFDAALSALGWGGRILLVGFVGGVQQIPANRLLVKHRAALGSSLRYFRWHAPDKLRRSVDELLRWYAEGRLRPLITHRLPLERTVEGIRLLTDRKAHGKIVVLP
jgi:NADPH2:quinone reductase